VDEILKGMMARIREKGGSEGFRCLVADDKEDVRDMLVSYLDASGFTCIEVTNGRDALVVFSAMMKERPSYFRFVFLDGDMPLMCGGETLQRILDLDPSAIVVMITTESRDKLFWGAAAQFDKPFDFKELLMFLESKL
jgi:DNA-binding response OmpR family regulator